MSRKVTKAIFPVAGMGTRFLPATKSIPKEIMTLVDRPLVQYAIDEARAAGITDFIFVTARGKSALADYFDRARDLEANLREKKKTKLLEELEETNMKSGTIAYIRQDQALGLGHAVWCARRLIGDEPFAVMLPDDIIAADVPVLKQMVEAYEDQGGNMVAAMNVTREETAAYGILDADDAAEGACTKVRAMVEKPDPAEAPSTLAVIGRYILSPEIMGHLDTIDRGAGGEIQLTDAIAKEIARADNVSGFRFEGRRYDCGTKSGFLRATVAFALERPDLRDDLRAFLEEVTSKGW